MAISVVQSVSGGQNTTSLNFPAGVTAGNSVVLIVEGFDSGGASSSNPTYNGSTPAGSAKLIELNVTVENIYGAVWLMPNLSGGGTSTGISVTGGSNGYIAVEIAGLGTTPQLDSNGGSSLAYGTDSSTGMPSGFTPALAASEAILLGTGSAFGVSSYTTPGGWTNLPFASFSCAQYQIVTGAAGSTYQYNAAGTGSRWGSLIVAITNPAAVSAGFASAWLKYS